MKKKEPETKSETGRKEKFAISLPGGATVCERASTSAFQHWFDRELHLSRGEAWILLHSLLKELVES